MTDYILELSFDARDAGLEEAVQSRLFLTASTGSSSAEINGTTTVSAYFDSPKTIAVMRDVLRGFDRKRIEQALGLI